MDAKIFMLGVLAVSIGTGLVTEAVKKVMSEYGKSYYANTVAGVISVLLAVGLGIGYVLFSQIEITISIIVCIIALAFTSWLCAMVGYDKVIQAISQFKTYGKDEETEYGKDAEK